MTAGFRSTEFWSSSFASLVGASMVAVGLATVDHVLSVGGAGLIGVAISAYCHSVGKRKAQRPYLPPIGKI